MKKHTGDAHGYLNTTRCEKERITKSCQEDNGNLILEVLNTPKATLHSNPQYSYNSSVMSHPAAIPNVYLRLLTPKECQNCAVKTHAQH